jgi:hypothetical protein
MTSNQIIVVSQTALIACQVGVAAFQAWIYSRQPRLMQETNRLMEETKNLSAKISEEQKSYQIALSRPALTISVEWEVDEVVKRFAIVATNSGNGPARLGRFELTLDNQLLATRARGDYDVIAQRLFPKHGVRSCGGHVTFGDYWLCAGGRQLLFHVTLNPGFPREHMPELTARLNASMEYGSVIPDVPPNQAWLRPPEAAATGTAVV